MEVAADGADAVYVSIDAGDLIRAAGLLGGYDVVGAVDLCEVSPPLDPSGRTAHLAVTTLIAFLRRYIYEQVDLADL